jgi:hypothetical protein
MKLIEYWTRLVLWLFGTENDPEALADARNEYVIPKE